MPCPAVLTNKADSEAIAGPANPGSVNKHARPRHGAFSTRDRDAAPEGNVGLHGSTDFRSGSVVGQRNLAKDFEGAAWPGSSAGTNQVPLRSIEMATPRRRSRGTPGVPWPQVGAVHPDTDRWPRSALPVTFGG